MSNWLRVSPFGISPDRIQTETWISKSPNGKERSYQLKTNLGKPIDILSLKLNMVENFASQVSYHKLTRTRLFGAQKMEKVDKCPICGLSARLSKLRLEVHGGRYHQCPECSHCFVIKKPTKAAQRISTDIIRFMPPHILTNE